MTIKRYAHRRDAACSVSGCTKTTDGFSKLCNRHKRRALLNGNPTTRAVRRHELRHARKEVRLFLKTFSNHEAIVKATAWLDELLSSYGARGAILVSHGRKPTTYQQRLACELYRLRSNGCTGAEVLEEVATVFRFTQLDPHRLPRHTREQDFNTARLVLGLRPRFSQRVFVKGTDRLTTVTSRLSSVVLDQFGNTLNRTLVTILIAMCNRIDQHVAKEERLKRELNKAIEAAPFVAVDAAA